MAVKVNVDLASHWPRATDISGSPGLGEGGEHPPMVS